MINGGKRLSFLAGVLLVVLAQNAFSDDWPSFRGRNADILKVITDVIFPVPI